MPQYIGKLVEAEGHSHDHWPSFNESFASGAQVFAKSMAMPAPRSSL
jgi:hypothetical protein